MTTRRRGPAGTSTPLAVARVVRLTATSVAVGVMAAVGPLHSLTAEPGELVRSAPTPTPGIQQAVADAIDAQQARGLSCSDDPVLTDVVLFQYSASDEVVVLGFDDALRETAARTGWVRGYCA